MWTLTVSWGVNPTNVSNFKHQREVENSDIPATFRIDYGNFDHPITSYQS